MPVIRYGFRLFSFVLLVLMFPITNFGQLSVSINAEQNSICPGGSAIINSSVSGNSGQVTYSWNAPQAFTGIKSNPSIIADTPGNYTLVVGDEKSLAISETESIFEFSFSVSINPPGGAYCAKSQGLTLSAATTSEPKGYMWEVPIGFSGGTESASIVANVPGSYKVVVLQNGCEVESKAVVVEEVNLGMSLNSDDPSSVGASNGKIGINMSGGFSPYSWTYSKQGGGNDAGNSNQSSFDITNLGSGTYNVSVTDKTGCLSTGAVSLSEPACTLVLAGTSMQPSCPSGSDGSISLTISDGKAPYDISWDGPVDGITLSTSSNFVIQNLPAGSYVIKVTDNTGCADDIVIEVTSPPSLDVNIEGDLVYCSEAGGTVLSAEPEDFKSYQWSDGTSGTSTVATSSGSYSVTVSYGNGCMATSSVNVTELPPLLVSIVSSQSNLQESCMGACDGEITVSVSGGSDKGRTYSWTGPGGYSASSQNISNLCPGNYTLVVSDSEGCFASFSSTVDPGGSLQLNLSDKNPSCSGSGDGEITVNFSGGAGPYMISWTGAESGSISNFSNGDVISGLNSGNYTVNLSDSNGCGDNATSFLSNPSTISFVASELSPSCSGSNTGSIFVDKIMNGVAPYTIVWTIAGLSNSAETSASFYTIELLVAGEYEISIKDANGCISEIETVIVTEEDDINVNIVGDIILCADQVSGTLSTNPGGFSDYRWSTGATTASIVISATGDYAVTVTDGGGCTGVSSVKVTRATSINISTIESSSVLSVSCDNSCDGKITPKVDGGNPPYQYEWSGPGGFAATTQVIDNLCPGTYTLTIVDANDCEASYSQQIVGASTLTVKLEASPVSCPGEKDGAITSEVGGGTAPYTYSWSNGSTSANTTDLSPGSYTLTVTDAKGCATTASETIGVLSGVDGSVNPSTAHICEGESVVLSASGGVSYLWSTGASSPSIAVSPLENTTYSVTITGSSGKCSDIKTSSIQVSNFPDARIQVNETSGLTNGDGDICMGANVTLQAQGGASYVWEGGFSNPLVVSPETDMTYTVTISDAFGCSTVLNESITVLENPSANIDLTNFTNVAGVNQSIGNASDANCGSIANCRWEIDGVLKSSDCGDIMHNFANTGDATILLQVENSCGCVDSDIKTETIAGENDCRLDFNTNGGNSGCTGTAIPLNIDFTPQTGCALSSSSIKVTENGVEVSTYELEGSSIIFTQPGNYEVEAAYEDNCSCSSSTSRSFIIVEEPSAIFSDENILSVCENSLIEVFLSGYDPGEEVTVIFDGLENTYVSPSFQLFVGAPGTYVVQMTKVGNGSCEKTVLNETLELQVVENLSVLSASYECSDVDGTYSLTITTTGGDTSSPINVQYQDAVVIGETITFFNLDPQIQYEFAIQRGALCEPIIYAQAPVPCNCTFNTGTLNDEIYFVGCSGSFYDISEIADGSDVMSSIFDTMVYVLHDGDLPGELGVVYDIFPLSQTSITNDFPMYTPNKRYELSLVTFRKFDFKSMLGEGLIAFNFLSLENCVSVSNTVPVIWHGSEVSISGPSQVCENAYNEIFVSSGIGEGAEIDINIEGLTSENYSFVPTDGRLYVHFVSGTAEEVPISISTRTFHNVILKGDTINTTCESNISYLVNIDEAHEAPDTSKVILWPGGIFASTDTTENICHRWGKTTRISPTETLDTIFQGATDRFYYGDEDDVISLNENRQVWVETYFCDDPVCFTRNIYNGKFPINAGDGVSSEEDVVLLPNPSEGEFVVSMSNMYRGAVKMDVYDIHGRHIYGDDYYKSGNVVNKTVDLQGAPNGVYVVLIELEGGERYIRKAMKQRD